MGDFPCVTILGRVVSVGVRTYGELDNRDSSTSFVHLDIVCRPDHGAHVLVLCWLDRDAIVELTESSTVTAGGAIPAQLGGINSRTGSCLVEDSMSATCNLALGDFASIVVLVETMGYALPFNLSCD